MRIESPPLNESFADRLFRLRGASGSADDQFIEKCCEIFGVKFHDTDHWPFDELGYDEYDNSFEIYGVPPETVLSPEQQQKFWALGFTHGWLNYAGGGERHYSPTTPAPEFRPTETKHCHEAKMRRKLVEQRDALLKAARSTVIVLAELPSYDGGCGDKSCALCEADANLSRLKTEVDAAIAKATGQ